MDLQGGEPAARFTFTFEFCLSGLKGISGNVPQQVHVALCLPALPLAFLDRVQSLPGDCAPFGRFLTCFLQRYFWIGAKPHFTAATVHGHVKQPFAAL